MSGGGSCADPALCKAPVASVAVGSDSELEGTPQVITPVNSALACESQYLSPYPTLEVKDLFILYRNQHKERPFQKWAKISSGTSNVHVLDARVTMDGGVMLCVVDQTFWSAAEPMCH